MIHTMALPGNPRGRAFRCGCSGSEAGRRRAIGVVAALQFSAGRPCRWCDAGTPKADQKAGADGTETETAPVTVPASVAETVAVSGTVSVSASVAGAALHRGVPGLTLCRHRPPGNATRPAQCHAGQPSRQNDPVHLHQLGRRPPLARSAWSQNLQSPSARPRCSGDAGPP